MGRLCVSILLMAMVGKYFMRGGMYDVDIMSGPSDVYILMASVLVSLVKMEVISRDFLVSIATPE